MATICIIDDDSLLLGGLLAALSEAHGVRGFSDPMEGLRHLENSPTPDLVILDWNMPGLNGPDVAQRMKANDKLKAVPILFFSSMRDEITIQRGLELGANDFIPKPFNLAEFKARVNVALRISSAEKELRRVIQRLDFELMEVGKLQESFLKKGGPPDRIHGLRHKLFYLPAFYASGDYYEIHQLPDGAVLICIADVSGHGAAAAVIMSLARIKLREGINRGFLGEGILRHLNELIQDYFPVRYFLTMFFMILNPLTRTIQYLNCGHPPAIIRRHDQTILLESSIPPVGLFHSPPRLKPFQLEKGDRMLLYTDGLIEPLGPDPDGMKNLIHFIESTLEPDLEKWLRAIIESRFSPNWKGEPGMDDIAMIGLDIE